MSELIQMLPVVALRGMTVLPDMVIHFDVSRESSVHAIEQAMLREQRLFLVTQKNTQTENPGFEDLYRIGTIASVKQVIKLPHNILRVLAEGLERGELSHLDLDGDYPEAEVIRFEEEPENIAPDIREAMIRSLKETCQESGKPGKELERQMGELEELSRLIRQLMIHLPLHYEEKQKLLEAGSLSEQFELLGTLMNKEIGIFAL